MSHGLLKNLLAVLALLLLAVTPAALRVGDGHPRWVLVRVGARPAQDDPDHQLVRRIQGQFSSEGEEFGPAVLVIGILCALAVLVMGVYERGVGRGGVGAGPPVEAGLCACVSGRAPPAWG